MIGSGVLKAVASAFSQFNAFITLAIEDAKVIEGITWSVRRRYTVSAGATKDVILDPTAFSGQIVVLQPIGFDAIGGHFDIEIYRGATADNDGTLVKPFNRDLSIATFGEVILRESPSNVVAGADKIMDILIPSNGTGAASSSGISSSDSIVLKLDTTKKYLIRIVNHDVAEAEIGIKTDHFEVI